MKSKFAALFTVFLGALGYGLLLPVVASFLMGESSIFFGSATSQFSKGIVLSLVIACFYVGMVIGGPLLGMLSDRIGRKKILIISSLFHCISYGLMVLSVETASISLLMLARVFSGMGCSNMPVAQAAFNEASEGAVKASLFALVAMTWGMGFILGPFLGGSLKGYVPFYIGMGLSLFNMVTLMAFFEETLKKKNTEKFSLVASVKRVFLGADSKAFRNVLVVVFLFSLGWEFFSQFVQVHLQGHLGFERQEVGYFFMWIAIWLTLSQALFVRSIVARFNVQKLLPLALIGLGVSFGMLAFAQGKVLLAIFLPFVAFFQAFIYPCAGSMSASSKGDECQGEVLGIMHASQYVCAIFLPILAGPLVALFSYLPFVVSGLCMLLASMFFIRSYKVKNLVTNK